MSKNKIDLGMARRYLKALAPDAEQFTFQTFSDTKDWKGRVRAGHGDPHARVSVSSFDKASKTLSEKNAFGVGVFVTINKTDGRGRKSENLKAFRAVFADMDADKCKTTMPRWPLKPSIVVASNGGKNRHVYWLVDGDISEAVWKGIGAHLVEKYGADSNATDTVRVLRVPGFYHCKGKPALVKLLECNGRRYTAGALVEAFPPIVRKPKRRSAGAVMPADVNRGALRSALEHLAATPHPRLKHGGTYVDDYETWMRFGLAIKRDLGDEGFDIWDEWGRFSDRYPGEENSRQKWDNAFDVETRAIGDVVHVGTIFHTARLQGWSFTRYQVRDALRKARAAMRQSVEVRP